MKHTNKKNVTPQVIQDCHELLLWMIPILDKFPRVRRFTLGERIENTLLVILELLVKAAWTTDKKQSLVQANLELEIIRHLWRLAFELKVIAIKRYEYGSKQINNLGNQIGGWIHAMDKR